MTRALILSLSVLILTSFCNQASLGAPIGGGGRYDELLGRFGRPLPAVGFALGVDRLHIALAGEERGTGALLAAAAAGESE